MATTIGASLLAEKLMETVDRLSVFHRLRDCVRDGSWTKPDAPVSLRLDLEASTKRVVAVEVALQDAPLKCTILIDRSTWLPQSYSIFYHGRLNTTEIRKYRHVIGGSIVADYETYHDGKVTRTYELQSIDTNKRRTVDYFARPKDTSKTKFDPEVSPDIEVKKGKSGKLFVAPKINGKKIGWLLFDTGAYRSHISEEVASKIGLGAPLNKTTSTGVGGGNAYGSTYRIDTFELGPMTVEPRVFASMEVTLCGDNLIDGEVVGVLGCDIIRQGIFEFSSRQKKISIHDPTKYRLNIGTWEPVIVDYSPHIDARLPNSTDRYTFCLDTGANGLFVGAGTPAAKLLESKTGSLEKARGFGGSSYILDAEIDWVEFGNRRVNNVRLSTSLNTRDPYDDYDQGLIGIYLLYDFTLVFDLKNSRIGFIDT